MLHEVAEHRGVGGAPLVVLLADLRDEGATGAMVVVLAFAVARARVVVREVGVLADALLAANGAVCMWRAAVSGAQQALRAPAPGVDTLSLRLSLRLSGSSLLGFLGPGLVGLAGCACSASVSAKQAVHGNVQTVHHLLLLRPQA